MIETPEPVNTAMALIHLIYVSHARTELDAADLDRILDSSIRHNTPQHVTGMLLYANGSFMQVLEGEESAVDETFGRIERDRRHDGVFLLERNPIAERSFENWSMGFRRLDAADAAAHPGFSPCFETGFDAQGIGAHPGLALQMLTNFAGGQESGTLD